MATKTGTCLDSVLPKGLFDNRSVLLLATDNGDDMRTLVSLVVTNLSEHHAVLQPGCPETVLDSEHSLFFVGDAVESLGRVPWDERRRSWLDYARGLRMPRLLYSSPSAIRGTNIEATADAVIRLAPGRGGRTYMTVVRNDLDAQTKGWSMPFSDQPLAPPKPPMDAWEMLDEDIDDL